MSEHPQIELYITIGDDKQNAELEQLLSSTNVDGVVARTLSEVHVTNPVMLTVLVTDDEGIRDMNKQYREIDNSTDVLSFPLLTEPLVEAPADQLWTPQESEEAQPYFVTPPDMIMNLGDVVLSWPTIVRQAEQVRHAPMYELLYLLSHGVLHLVGYDDHTEAGYQAMVGIQQRVLQAVGMKTM
ncbi:MAG TPA: rRNA maturation RNase YbeY [Ktedonobacter sp.]|nr:rRNA maturation RNase YbeY [Ktedonobacter sp.]